MFLSFISKSGGSSSLDVASGTRRPTPPGTGMLEQETEVLFRLCAGTPGLILPHQQQIHFTNKYLRKYWGSNLNIAHCALLLPLTVCLLDSLPYITFFSHFTLYVLDRYASFKLYILSYAAILSVTLLSFFSFAFCLFYPRLFSSVFFNSKSAPGAHYVAVFPPSAITFVLFLISFLSSFLPLSRILHLFTKSPFASRLFRSPV